MFVLKKKSDHLKVSAFGKKYQIFAAKKIRSLFRKIRIRILIPDPEGSNKTLRGVGDP
jgi:hypothetical protein